MLQTVIDLPRPFLILLFSLVPVIYAIIRAAFDPLRSVPGPFLARFTRLWYFYKVWCGDFELVNVELHKRYGPIVRIAPGQYSFDDVDAARVVYGSGAGFVKSNWYWAWMPPNPASASLFSDMSNTHHGTQRRKFASAYSMTSLLSYEEHVNSCTRTLISRFSEISSASTGILDLGHWLQCYAFDVIGSITFGTPFGILNTGIDEDSVFEAIDNRGVYSTFVGIFPFLHRWLFPLLPSSGGHAYVSNFTKEKIAARAVSMKDFERQEDDGPADFMTKFFKVHEASPERMTRKDIFTMCQSNIGAGSDTTAITLSAIFYHLIKNPESMRKLVAEVDDVYERYGFGEGIVTFKQAQEMPYLQAVVKEGSRLHSATGLPMWRVVPADGVDIAGRRVEQGTVVGVNAWVAHRNKHIFGADADIWRPERWSEIEAAGRGGAVEKYFFAFGMGSRTCIGKNISLLEIQKLIPTLLRRFEFRMKENNSVRAKENWTTLNRWFVKPYGFEAVIRERQT